MAGLLSNDRLRSCVGKAKHLTEGDAKIEAYRFKRKRPIAYKCRYCSWWHTGEYNEQASDNVQGMESRISPRST